VRERLALAVGGPLTALLQLVVLAGAGVAAVFFFGYAAAALVGLALVTSPLWGPFAVLLVAGWAWEKCKGAASGG
jgi:hypothetical protein